MSKITACIPCYNDYPYIILTIRSAINIFDKVIVSDCSDDEYTYKSILSNFSDESKVKILKPDRWLDWVENRNNLIRHIDTEYSMWMDANDVFCENMSGFIRNSILKIRGSDLWSPKTVRTYGSFQTSDRYNLIITKGRNKTPFQVDPCHFAVSTGKVRKWDYNKKGKNPFGASAYDKRGTIIRHNRQVMNASGNKPCLYHLHGFGLMYRNRVRKILKNFIENKRKMAELGYKSPLDRIVKTNDMNHDGLYATAHNIMLHDRKILPDLPRSIVEELNKKEFYEFKFNRDGIPTERTIKFEGSIIEHLKCK